MRAPHSSGPVTAGATRAGFWCEFLLVSAEADNTVLVGSFDAYAARDAVRWIRIAVRMLVSVADEAEAEPVHEWLLFGGRPTAAALERGEPFAIALRHKHLHLAWSARPVGFLPLADRTGRTLPPCALEWAQPAALRAALTASQHTHPSARR
ncbi:hypothetical protein GTY20_09035 [Streptomyces sp. SID4946]|uniref:hypothetical protein n=1 Tax=Streptomyces sp. LamerLS-31b TaxID=1839765 RepID=UPI00081D97A5|nr:MULTISPECIES: hypothetical protein [unclassified Streptomyces]MYQ91461.1 hypothetical protein [Streptomyces sp. SID4946]SCF67690.1 hypothetical protein GA0115256_111311 [Streptomyces sp. DconLS]SCF79440.1 hypothetical protein GA0115258_112574 [Streptomyces sp. LamerLS-31b]